MTQNCELANLLKEIAKHAPEAFKQAVTESGLLDPDTADSILRETEIEYKSEPDDAK